MGSCHKLVFEGDWLLVELADSELFDGFEDRVVRHLRNTKFDIHLWKLMDFYYYLNAFPQNKLIL